MTRALLLWAACAMFVAYPAPAHAHQDLILPVTADGAIPDIPPEFGPVQLTLVGLGSDAPVVTLRIGAHQSTLPLCAARLIRSKSLADVTVAASWYHDEDTGLPYYIGLHFLEPGRKPRRSYNSEIGFLFNLHDATLIHAKSFKADQSGGGGQYTRIDVAADCRTAVGGRIKTL